MLLKPAVEKDFEEVVDLANLAYRGRGESASWNAETGIIEGVRITNALLHEDLAKPGAELLVWRDDAGVLMGTAFLQPKEDGVWYLGLLTVRPGLQNRGLGKEVLASS